MSLTAARTDDPLDLGSRSDDLFPPICQPAFVYRDGDVIVEPEFDLRCGELMFCSGLVNTGQEQQQLHQQQQQQQRLQLLDHSAETTGQQQQRPISFKVSGGRSRSRNSEDRIQSKVTDDYFGCATTTQTANDLETSLEHHVIGRSEEGRRIGGGVDVLDHKRIPDSVWTEFTETFRAIESAVIEGLRCSISVHHQEITIDRPLATPVDPSSSSSTLVTCRQIIVAPKPPDVHPADCTRALEVPINLCASWSSTGSDSGIDNVRIKKELPEAQHPSSSSSISDFRFPCSSDSGRPVVGCYKVEDSDVRPSCVFWPRQFRQMTRTVTASASVPGGGGEGVQLSASKKLFSVDSSTVTTARFEGGGGGGGRRHYLHVSPSLPTEYFRSSFANKSACRYSAVETFRTKVRRLRPIGAVA